MKEKELTDYTLDELVAHYSAMAIMELGRGEFKMYDAMYRMAERVLYWKHQKDQEAKKNG